MLTESKIFPPLLWSEVEYKQRLRWPFPVINGERTEASAGLLAEDSRRSKALPGARERRTKDDCSDVEDAPW